MEIPVWLKRFRVTRRNFLRLVLGGAAATAQKTSTWAEAIGWNLALTEKQNKSPQPNEPYLAKYKHLQLRYSLTGDGVSQLCEKQVLAFNRGIRRDPLLLVTGDKAAFALMITEREDRPDPDLLKLGDGCFSVDGHSLFENEASHAVFDPDGTVWWGDVDKTILWKMTTKIFGNRGQRTELQISNSGSSPRRVQLSCTYGGLRHCGRPNGPPYFNADPLDGVHDEVSIKDRMTIFKHSSIPGVSVVAYSSIGNLQILDGKARWADVVDVNPGETSASYLVSIWGRAEDEVLGFAAPDNIEKVLSETQKYYQEILTSAIVRTPNPLIDAGFKASLLNLDYVYSAPAWFEGGHWWAAFWCNNYQISAAISAGQLERAKKALAYFAAIQGGPYPIVYASGKPNSYSGISKDPLAGYEEGIPYYLHQLLQHYEHTGDFSLLASIWPQLAKSTDRLLAVRDLDGDGLLDWKFGSNTFLYQADHLGMPGNAASTSLIMAGLLDRLAAVAGENGLDEDSRRWKQRSALMKERLLEKLWNPEEGCFWGHVDHQSIHHPPHYYTDLVFPALYSGLSPEYAWLSLQWLSEHFWESDSAGLKRLMRVGDMKPNLFGNDNIMPTQMAEAARAYFDIGEMEQGAILLESVALAATVHTDAPGSFPERMDAPGTFPERMSNEGKGLANYMFGNPTGSYLYSVVRGLFGIELQDGGQTLYWRPGFPSDWTHAELKLNYAQVSFQSDAGLHEAWNEYIVENPIARKVRFRLFVRDARLTWVEIDGRRSSAYSETPGIGGMWVSLETPRLQKVKFRLGLRGKSPQVMNVAATAGSTVEVQLPGMLTAFHDWQHCVREMSHSGTSLRLATIARPGTYHVGIECGNIPVIIPVKITLAVEMAERLQDTRYSGPRPRLPIELSKLRDSAAVWAISHWRAYDPPHRLQLEDLKTVDGFLETPWADFELPDGDPYFVQVEYGRCGLYDRKLVRSDYPSRVEIPIARMTPGIALLFASEFETRLTGAAVGRIGLKYDHGEPGRVPLIVGKNIDALSGHFASDLNTIDLSGLDHINVLVLKTDASRLLEKLIVEIDTADAYMALISLSVC